MFPPSGQSTPGRPKTSCTKRLVNPHLQSFGCGLQTAGLQCHLRTCRGWTARTCFRLFSPEWLGEQADESQLSCCCDEQKHFRGGVRASDGCIAPAKPGRSCDTCDVFPLTTSKDNNSLPAKSIVTFFFNFFLHASQRNFAEHFNFFYLLKKKKPWGVISFDAGLCNPFMQQIVFLFATRPWRFMKP